MRPMYEKLLSKRNVVGVGIGYKVTDGERTDQLSIITMVERKFDEDFLSSQDIVPKTYAGFPTDVIATGKFKALETTGRHRPAPGGVSIGHVDITAGTLGCVVRNFFTDEPLILSNNHVLANSNDGKISDPILQPGPADNGRYPQDFIATLLDFVPIMFETPACLFAETAAVVGNAVARVLGSSKRLRVMGSKEDPFQYNVVDAAIAKPVNDDDVTHEILNIGLVSGVKEAELGMPLRKHGRTTDYNEDIVLTVGTTIDVSYGTGKTARFEEQIVAGAMSAGGDSGSLVLNNNDAVGLLFAGSNTHTILNPIGYVLSELNIKF